MTLPAELDTDFDTVPDQIECETKTPCPDFDQDGKPNHLDIDSDGDGIVDGTESTGIIFSTRHRAISLEPIDSDHDGAADYLDLDSDNDTIPDATEGHDSNGDGLPDVRPTGFDSDGDGLDDAYDTIAANQLTLENAAGNNAVLPSHSGKQPDWRNPDDDDDGIATMEEVSSGPLDSDLDGIPDYLDPTSQMEQIYLPFVVGGDTP